VPPSQAVDHRGRGIDHPAAFLLADQPVSLDTHPASERFRVALDAIWPRHPCATCPVGGEPEAERLAIRTAHHWRFEHSVWFSSALLPPHLLDQSHGILTEQRSADLAPGSRFAPPGAPEKAVLPPQRGVRLDTVQWVFPPAQHAASWRRPALSRLLASTTMNVRSRRVTNLALAFASFVVRLALQPGDAW